MVISWLFYFPRSFCLSDSWKIYRTNFKNHSTLLFLINFLGQELDNNRCFQHKHPLIQVVWELLSHCYDSSWCLSFSCRFLSLPYVSALTPSRIRSQSRAYLLSLPRVSALFLVDSRTFWCTNINGRMTKAQFLSDERCQLISLSISMFGQTVLTMFRYLCSDLLIWTMYRLVVGSFTTWKRKWWCYILGILSLTMPEWLIIREV